jgi:hypothetical protein
MTKMTVHLEGFPCWLDASVASRKEREDLMAFYSGLFGWRFEVGAAETGSYSMAYLGDSPVLAIGEQPGGQGQWVTYFATSDIAASQKAVAANGGQVFLPAMKVMDVGSMALALDASGAVHGLWQAENFAGFGVMNEPNSLGWFDHVSTDTQRAANYYLGVLGSEFQLERDGEMTILRRGEQWFASLSLEDQGEKSPQWMPVFVVDSLKEAKIKVRKLGGEIIVEEMPVPGSSISVIREPITGQYITMMAAGQAA